MLQAFYGWHSFNFDSQHVYDSAKVVSVDATCNGTQLTLSGVPRKPGNPNAPDSLYFQYENLFWRNNHWVPADTVEAFPDTTNVFNLQPIYSESLDLVVYDARPDSTGEYSEESVVIDTTLHDMKAYSFHLTYEVEARGGKDELTNEMNRPVSDSVLIGLSAPFTVLFHANPTPRASYIDWNILLGASPATTARHDSTFRYTFTGSEDAQAYTVTLHCQDKSNSCELPTQTVAVSVALSKLLVPNVFTPNGDGLNDEFRVLYQSLKEFHIWVYNRWGKQVFSTDNPDTGWDGYISGQKAAEGAYFYVIRAKGEDGQVYKLGGDINLIRGNN